MLTHLMLCGLNGSAEVLSVDSAVTPEKGRVGDIFTYTVTVHGTGLDKITAVLPEQKSYFPGPADKKRLKADKGAKEENVPPLYEVRSAELLAGKDASCETLTARLTLMYMKPGTYTLPEIKITGDDRLPIGYRPQTVIIIETNPEGAFEEIEGPLEPATDYRGMIFTALLLIFACALAVAAGYYIYRCIKKRRETAAIEIKISPYEQFTADIERLKPEELIASGDVRGYAFGMSITFRRFISAQCGFDAAEMTTDEIRRGLKKFMPDELHGAYAAEIMRCMDMWDISKFAEFTPSDEMLSENLRSVKNAAEKVSLREGDNVRPGV